MFIVTQDKELVNSEHVVKFRRLIGVPGHYSYLQAMMLEGYADINVYQGTKENVNIAFDNLLEAFMSNATVIDYSQNKESTF